MKMVTFTLSRRRKQCKAMSCGFMTGTDIEALDINSEPFLLRTVAGFVDRFGAPEKATLH